jgi:hypothetical protein
MDHSRSSSIGRKTKNDEVTHCISFVQRQMTLVTKLGCLFIMESIHQMQNTRNRIKEKR